MKKRNLVVKHKLDSELNHGYVNDPLMLVDVDTDEHNVVGNGTSERIHVCWEPQNSDLLWIVGIHYGLDYVSAAAYEKHDLSFVGGALLENASDKIEIDNHSPDELIVEILIRQAVCHWDGPMNAF